MSKALSPEAPMHRSSRVLLALLAALLVAAAATPVHAAIVCDGKYQIIRGQPHATPFCEDRLLARVARQAGFRYSEAQIRGSHGIKTEVCRAIGSDIRIVDTCRAYRDLPSHGPNRW
jgi:hypothetical protein